MLKALWILIQVLFVCFTFLSLTQIDGQVDLSWKNYVMEVHLGAALAAFFGFLFFILLVHKLLIHFFDIPKVVARKWEDRSMKKSHLSLTRALTLMSAGDYKHAAYHAYRAQKLLPERYEKGASTFIEAVSAQKMGQDSRARDLYKKLLDNKEGAFLGIQGLMQDDIQSQKFDHALLKANRARTLYPKQPWILKTVYDLQIRTGQFEEALSTLKTLLKADKKNAATLTKDEVALLVALSDEVSSDDPKQGIALLKRAVRLEQDFVPAVKRLALLYIDMGKSRAAQKVISACWKSNPHPELADIWASLAPENTARKPQQRLRWFEKLVALNPQNIESQIAAARAAIDDGLWGESRTYLMAAEKIEEREDVYQLWAELERLSTRNEEAEAAWLRKAHTALPKPEWICRLTHKRYNQWYAIAQPHGAFNTIVWQRPFAETSSGRTETISAFQHGLIASN